MTRRSRFATEGDTGPADKFIGYIDILGFKNLVHESEAGRGLSASEILEAQKMLRGDHDRAHFDKYGPTVCPEAPFNRKDIDFRVTQASDCVIVSAEVSPAGAINLINHCWGACILLLTKGLMCRGYITRGAILHTDEGQFGSGLNDATGRERTVSFYQRDADERGTPFVEVDPAVVDYVAAQNDACVKEIFGRLTKTQAGLTALFPIKQFNHSFLIGGFGRKFDPERERQQVEVVRGNIRDIKQRVARLIDKANPSAVRKGEHYQRMLDEQLIACDKTEASIDMFMEPFPRNVAPRLRR